MRIKTNDRILFIGDSITDGGRDRSDSNDLGKGYPLMIAGQVQAEFPDKNITFFNRGVGGDRLIDLKNRWEKDCLDLNPDVVSILIGINDTWHNTGRFRSVDKKELEEFEANYRYLLKSLLQRTDARIVLMEPFVLPYPKDRVNWRDDLDPRIQIVRKMAREYQTDLIPLDGIFNAEGTKYGMRYYTGEDGVHPTVAGYGVIAKAWMNNIDYVK